MGDVRPEPVLPDYAGACISNVAHALMDRRERLPGWLPAELDGSAAVWSWWSSTASGGSSWMPDATWRQR